MAGENLPRHIGFIPDGNRRWARARGLPTLEGHRRGYVRFEEIVEFFAPTGVEFLSFFTFSTENWQRSPEEVSYLMKLVAEMAEKMHKQLRKKNLRLVIMGRAEPVEPKLWQKLQQIEQDSVTNTGMTVCLCFNYGGQAEIADAAKKMVATGEQDFSPENFRRYLYRPEVPDCDLIVRTSGESRLSGFQLWRAAYSELLFLEKNFPDITAEDCAAILGEYQKRNRRFGK